MIYHVEGGTLPQAVCLCPSFCPRCLLILSRTPEKQIALSCMERASLFTAAAWLS